MLSIEEIKRFIDEDNASEKKKFAMQGQRYYEGDHDIKNYKLYYFNADGELVLDETRSNIKISHPFFTELVDQAAQYMLSGKNGFIKSDKPELQAKLNEYFNENEDFIAEMYEALVGTMSKGFEYMFAYKKEDGTTGFQCADSIGVVEVRAKDTDSKTDNIIYWYVDRIGKENKKVKRIEVWDKTHTYFYVQSENGQIEKDESQTVNPRPHIVKVDEAGNKYDGGGYGTIPFFRLDNCKKQFSDLKPIKELIDDYDLMACGLSNNLQDASEYLVVVSGFQGDNLDELITNTKTKKHIGVEEGGGVDFKTVDIPYQARQVKLELDEKNIYRFGMGFNSAQLGDGNITNIVIKSRYALLDMKCNKLEIRLKQMLRKMIDIVIKEVNDIDGKDYKSTDVYFDFEREVMTNAADNAQIELIDAQKQNMLITTLLNIASIIGDELLVEQICDVLDLDYEQIKDKLPKDEGADALEAQKVLVGVVTDEQRTEGSSSGAIE